MTGDGQMAIGGVAPIAWTHAFSAPPLLVHRHAGWPGAMLRRWRDVDPDIVQPPLDHHYVSLHLGGPKRLKRWGEGRTESVEAGANAISVVPAGSAWRWRTAGPIDFVHLYLSPLWVERVALELFGRDASTLTVADRLGVADPLLAALVAAMLSEVERVDGASAIRLDSLLHALTVQLLSGHADAPRAPLRARLTLSPAKLRRVRDHIEANLAERLTLADLAGVAAASPFHFSRAFAAATGAPPYAFVIRRRIERAKRMLVTGDAPIAEVSRACGFESPSQFARMFRQLVRCSPGQYRRAVSH